MVSEERRLARVVQQLLACSFSHAKHEILIGHVEVNGVMVVNPGEIVTNEASVEHKPDLPRRTHIPPGPTLEILHLDSDVVVINKPSGLLSHPTFAGEKDTVISRVAAAIGRRTGKKSRPLIVHRLDRDTSGVMVLALNHSAAEHLHRQFKVHSTERRYLALVAGDLRTEQAVERNIGRPRPGARRAALAPGTTQGRPAQTDVRPVERFGHATLIEAELGTGRTHQVRVHLSYLGHPVLGDSVYGAEAGDSIFIPRLALHATLLAFVHPRTGERLTFEQGLAKDLAEIVEGWRKRQARFGHPVREVVTSQRPARNAGANPRLRPHNRPRSEKTSESASPQPKRRRQPAMHPHPPRDQRR